MLFNSHVFIFVFLPVVIFGVFFLRHFNRQYTLAWLAAASLFFYGWWDQRFLPLLLLSASFNWAVGRLIGRLGRKPTGKIALAVGISSNLLLLTHYKYSVFFAGIIFGKGAEFNDIVSGIVLPLGISFYTFTQIAYLVDSFKLSAPRYSFVQYILFVTYFPHLIAGPIIHHTDVMPQFISIDKQSLDINVAKGIMFFIIGLYKKVMWADSVGVIAGNVFDASMTRSIDFYYAWSGALAYTLQIYFDFSGYSDMAIGLSLIFCIRLPYNFNSPYRAFSIIDFWRRWHMTLSAFLRDYLYIPLGGNRAGAIRRYINLMITMLLGGLWHGAGWTFVLWGALHGVYLTINHGWAAIRRSSHTGSSERMVYWVLTFLAVVVAWVFFRATTLESATNILMGMAGLAGWGPLPPIEWLLLLARLCIVAWALPNSQQIIDGNMHILIPRLRWSPNIAWATVAAALFMVEVLRLNEPSSFLYFNF